MISENDSNLSYFQFAVEQDYPVYISCDLKMLDLNLLPMLRSARFSQCDEKSVAQMHTRLREKRAKLLKISEASAKVSAQIGSSKFEDQFGPESVSLKQGYRIYRYKGLGLMIYAFSKSEWELGVSNLFGSEEATQMTRIILNRFSSWALCHDGIVGFWGAAVDEGIVVMKQSLAGGEAVFVDLNKNMVISVEGDKKLKPSLEILRLDRTLRDRTISMSKEELFSFLSNKCTFFDHNGLVVSIRQMIQAIVKNSNGVIHPLEDFRPRVDLSY